MNYGTTFEAWRAAAGDTWPAYMSLTRFDC